MPEAPRQLLLGAHFPGKEQVAWRHPDNEDLIAVETYIKNAKAADSALFHFMFLAETLSLAEHDGSVLGHTVNGRPDTIGIQSVLAGVTKHVGFINTLNSTYNEPYDLVRQLATLDVLSDGRAAWNLVTAAPPLTSANFSRGDFLPYEERYERAGEFLDVLETFWRGWETGEARPVERHFSGKHFSVTGAPSWPTPPQERPVIVQASSSDTGNRFGAEHADGVYIIPRDIHAAQDTYRRVKAHAADLGRGPDDVAIVAGLRFVVADTDAEAEEKFRHFLDLEFSDRDVVLEIERIWQRPLPDLDPDGPLPTIEPDYEALGIILSKSPAQQRDPRAYIREWRELAEAERLSNRQIVQRFTVRPAITGTPETIATALEHWRDTQAADGFIVQPQVVPQGVLEFAERVVPVLQERGLFRTEAPEQTLRSAWHSR